MAIKSPGRAAPERDVELAEAIDDLENMEREKVEVPSFASGILETMRLQKEEAEVVEPEPGVVLPPVVEPEAPGADPVKYPEVNVDDIKVSPKIKEKFQAFKERQSTLLSDLEEANKRIAEIESKSQSTEGFKALQEENEKLLARIEALSLEESPRFRGKYDAPVEAAFSKALPYIKSIRDADERAEVAALLDRAANAQAGEDKDPDFYAMVAGVTDGKRIPEHLKFPIYQAMTNLREAVNQRALALRDWKATKTKVDSEYDSSRGELAQKVDSMAAVVRSEYEAREADRLRVYRNSEAAKFYDYDAKLAPALGELREELKKSVMAGQPTRKVIELAQKGAELDFQVNLNAMISQAIQNLTAQNAELKARLEKHGISGTSGGKSASVKSGEPRKTDPTKFRGGSGILATIDEMKNA